MPRSRDVIDVSAGIELARHVLDAYTAGRGVFEDTSDLLEHQIPAGVTRRSKAHANFLFFLICQDHGVKSFRLYERAKALYADMPHLFDPNRVLADYASDQDPKLIADTGKRLGTRYQNESGRQWFRNSRALLEGYAGDAREIFSQSQDSLEALRRIRAFRGFGPKTSALLFRTFYGVGFFRLPRVKEVPIPVDIHDTRIAFVSGLLNPRPAPPQINSDNYMKYAVAAQAAWMRVCDEGSFDWLALDRALWLLGSRGCDPSRYLDCCLKANCRADGGKNGQRTLRLA